MVVPRSRLSFVFGVIALVALVATWKQNLHYFAGDGAGPAGGLIAFLKDTFATPASASITLDLGLFTLAVVVWMVLEARRLGIPFVWVYVVLGFSIAISVSFPLFLIARERRLATLGQVQPAITAGDALGLALLAGVVVAVSIWSVLG